MIEKYMRRVKELEVLSNQLLQHTKKKIPLYAVIVKLPATVMEYQHTALLFIKRELIRGIMLFRNTEMHLLNQENKIVRILVTMKYCIGQKL
jgi:hypothetical protein